MDKRADKPLCPYCKSELALFASTGQVSNEPPKVQSIVEPKYPLSFCTLYCTSAKCTGLSKTSKETGYDIKLNHI